MTKLTLKNLIATLALTSAFSMMFGSFAQAGTVELPIVQGHAQVAGGLHYIAQDKHNSDFNVSPGLEYFLVDRISLGASANLDWNKVADQTNFTHTLSPALTWYFLDLNPVVLFAHQTVDFGVASKASHPTGFTTSAGASIFFNKYVSFAPEVTWHYGSQVQGYWEVNGLFQTFF